MKCEVVGYDDTVEVSFEDVLKAKKVLDGVINNTKLIYSMDFSKEYGNDIYIKPENLQITGSFKIRGAYNKVNSLTDEQKDRGLIASSAGNHAQGVAYAANKLGIKATIVMPKTTPLVKVEATKKFGANVVLTGDCYDEAYAEAKRLESEEGYTFLHPFNDREVMAGQGTVALEILEELKDVDIILVPIGGGGLISGVAVAAKSINSNIKVIGVEAIGAMAMKESVDKGELISLSKVDTIADGSAVKCPGDKTFEVVKKYVDEIITVNDFELSEMVYTLMEKHKMVCEATGALSLAALKKLDVTGKKVVSIVSGGNIDVVTISELLNRGLLFKGRMFCFSVKLQDTPGELLRIAQILADCNANVIKLEHNQFKAIDRLRQVLLEITVETNGHDHINEIIASLNKQGYSIDKIY
ncbi:threonine ammonia-lyase [Clostridium cylindrosporum]|uniref:L-threonine dehydratase catabolic TdcB n=1 Tax=Clostridium cylindrosporum DSM 605 TaxID=1121307 RepID=A0A0J8DEP8_CLOCY|nr:threonine ammonia-lyase [Clostridium cylindrosporum]KMT22704.1 L-threonine dehydratase catabolic TdcB [Clostridium cylindrosporum DSM 605]